MLEKLSSVIDKSRITQNADMKKLVTFRTGGIADILISPTSTKELSDVIKFFCEERISYHILGKGSNVLINDSGLRNPVIQIGKNMSDVSVFENCITAQSGITLSSLASFALEHSLSGLEFASGIPGSLGGAIIMNAGAYGEEICGIVEAVSYIDPSGVQRVATAEEMEFSYRHSALSDTGCVITAATLNLKERSKEEILKKMNDLSKRRRDKQPLEYPSAGSTFKRPEGYFAGALIEEAGLKGKCIGGACVSQKHAGFIINMGEASTSDVLKLIEYVKEKVYEKSGVLLEPEVKFWTEEEIK